MIGQMNIFDFAQEAEDLETLPLEEMVARIADATGLKFKYAYETQDGAKYTAKIKNVVVTLCYSRALWKEREGQRFISTDYVVSNRWGQGGAFFSVADAIADLMHDLEELREKGVI